MPGQSLTLLSGTLVNTGTLLAPGGQITVASVPGEKLARISSPGNLISWDLPAGTFPSLSASLGTVPMPQLPQLLTGGDLTGATGVTVAHGIVTLPATQTPIPTDPGTTILSG